MIRSSTLILILCISTIAQGQFAIIGQNGESPDEVMLVTLEDIQVGEVFHLTDNEYMHSNNEFSIGEGYVTFATTSLVLKGEVFSIKNDGGWAVDDASNISVVSTSGNINISMGNEQSYIYQTINNLSDGSISNIVAAFDNWDGIMPIELNPILNYPNAIVLDLPLNIRNATFNGSREFSDLSEIYDFSNWEFSELRLILDLTDFSNTALPVDLSYFVGESFSKGYTLLWETLNEFENDRFSIERSINGSRFEEIGYVLGNGTTSSTNRYEYVDLDPDDGLNYYRLKQIDYNGQFLVSEIIVFDNRKQIEFNIYPTLVKDQLNIEIHSDNKREIKIFNESGGLVAQNNNILKNKTFDLSSLKSGIYYIMLYSELGIKSQKFIKL